ncbi:MAG TPA: zf-HC2 domain-containing protein [Patescibacteria group bacterium]|nr:zf-HC2 domain-containing protein [Patescibacteria group bacterium]
MIPCDEALEAAVTLAAGDVDPARRQRLEAHLLGCAACAGEAGRLRETLDVLGAGETPDPGAEYWRTFDARLRGRIVRDRANRRWRGIASLAAAVVAVAGVSIWTAGHRGAQAPAIADGARPVPTAPSAGAGETRPDSGEASLEAGDARIDAAEARLDEAINRLARQEQGERSFEAVLDEVLPAAPSGFDGGEPEKQENDAPKSPDNC